MILSSRSLQNKNSNSAQLSGRIGLVIVVCGMLGSMVSGIILDKWVEDDGGDGDHDDQKILDTVSGP